MPGDRGQIVLIAVTSIVVLALIGCYQLDPAGLAAHPADYLYRIVQLFAAEGDWTHGQDLPLALQVARFFAPIVTIASLVLIFAQGIWTALVNAKARFYRDHIVIVGLSDAALEMVKDCRMRKVRVVIVERSAENPHIAECRSMRVPLFVSDGRQIQTLARVRTAQAHALLSFISSDDDNVELSLRIQEHTEATREINNPLKVLLKVQDPQLAGRLESYPKFFEYPQQMEVRFFNLDEQAARGLFREYYPEVYADALGMRHVHIVIVGYAHLGRHVLMTALKHAHYSNGEPLRLSVLASDAARLADDFTRQCPDIGIAADVHFLETHLTPESLRATAPAHDLHEATMFVSCVGSDSDNLTMALGLRQMALLNLIPNAPIFVGLRYSRGLASLVESTHDEPEIPDGLYPFGMIDRLMQMDHIVNESIDELAIALHERYLRQVGERKVAQPSHRPWGTLPEIFRNENRAQADHVAAKLRASGNTVAFAPTDFQFSNEEVERLAKIEKARWNAERASLGWTYAEHRSDLGKLHPGLKSWADSTPAEREYDLDSVRALPEILNQQLQRGITQQIIIGVTGHRSERIAGHLDTINERVRQELRAIGERYPGARFAVLSALADGSDRLVAQLAREELRATLIATLPLPYEIYKRSFGNATQDSNIASNLEFQQLVGRASIYFEMPLRFGGAQLLERESPEGATARSHQYALAGGYIVSRCHELIAIWDGESSPNPGGTADVVRWRTEANVPSEYRFESSFFPIPPMHPPRVITLDNGLHSNGA